MPRISALLLFSLFALPLSLFSQSVHWDPAGGSLARGQVSQIQLVFENCQPDSNAQIPSIAGLELQLNGNNSNSFSSVNGRTTISTGVGINVRPTTESRVTIPAFKIKTDKGEIEVASVSFDIGAATVKGTSGNSNNQPLTLDQVAQSTIATPQNVWAGEVFPLTYSISANKRLLRGIADNPTWDSLPLNIEPWNRNQTSDTLKNGESWVNIRYATRASVRTSGEISLKPAQQAIGVVTGQQQNMFDPFGMLGGGPVVQEYTLTSEPSKVTVKPLPAGAPASFVGAVGKFTLESKVVPASTTINGDPITWTLTLKGVGNWPDIAGLPPRAASKDFRVVQSQPKRTPAKEGALYDFTLSEDVVLVPTKPGSYTLGPVEWTYFDPEQGRYETIRTPATTVTIIGISIPTATASAQPGTSNPAAQNAFATASAPPPPNALPGEPITPPATTNAPLEKTDLVFWLLLAGLWPLLLWIILAARRTARTDPNRPQREARARLAKILSTLDQTPATERARITSLLQQWQHETATLWRLPQVVPAAAAFQQKSPNDPQTAGAWATLWTEAERTLYRPGTPLPPNWVARAHDALTAKRVPGYNPLTLFRSRNLFPFAAALLIFFSSFTIHSSLFGAPSTTGVSETTPASHTSEAIYKSGNFSAAETAWRKQAAAAPTDWTARHNLSLALAQQDRWSEAAAQALAAFVQNPGDPAVKRTLLLALQHAGYTPTTAISEVMHPGPVSEVALRYSPAHWQCFLGCAVALAGIAFALLLVRAYSQRFRRTLLALACIAFAVAICVVTISLLSLRAYGMAKDERAVIVWKSGTLHSIPTVADTTQKTTPLAAGTIAIADKNFPGWVRLEFENGQTGWCPRENITALWK